MKEPKKPVCLPAAAAADDDDQVRPDQVLQPAT
jgi:hypothetical protein